MRGQVGLRRLGMALLVLALLFVAIGGDSTVLAQRPDDRPLQRGPQEIGPDPAKVGQIGISGDTAEAPVLQGGPKGQAIPGQYIVVFKPGAAAAAAGNARGLANNLAAAHGGTLLVTYESALEGFAAQLPDAAVRALQNNPNIAYIEQDQVVTLADTQTGATWGLDRIDQRDRPLNGTYVYNATGAGVNAYIIDTGIRLTHNEFGGRAVTGYDAVTAGGSATDCNGHGTHVAGTVGGATYGVAKQVRLYAIRVLNCSGSGTNSGVIAGVDWVTANHIKPAVANMSLGGGASTALDNAVNNSINAGVTYAVAAGNDNRNACNYSPARVPNAVTVGSTTSTDARSSFSNYGSCLDIFAPGSSITAAWYTSNSATNTISGTSMASPHVAGVAALYLQANPNAAPLTVRNAIVGSASTGKVSSAGTGSPNALLYSLLSSAPSPTPTATPPAQPTATPPSQPTATPPPSGGNVLVNPGFESGRNVGWSESSSGGYALVSTDRPRSGSWSAWLGGYNNAIDYIQQTVTVPSNGQLSYWWRMESSEPNNTAYDWMEVRLYNSSGSYLGALRRWSNGNTRNAWVQDTLNLSGYAGQTVRLRFYVDTDYSYSTSFFVDDTNLR